MNKLKLATKMNGGKRKGAFLSDAWLKRKDSIAKRVARRAELNRKKSAKRWEARKGVGKRLGVNPKRVIWNGEGVELTIKN